MTLCGQIIVWGSVALACSLSHIQRCCVLSLSVTVTISLLLPTLHSRCIVCSALADMVSYLVQLGVSYLSPGQSIKFSYGALKHSLAYFYALLSVETPYIFSYAV